MNLRRVGWILAKDLRGGPRSGVVLWAVAMPVVLTLLLHGVFGELFASEPRLGLVDPAGSQVAAALRDASGLAVREVADEATLARMVYGHDLDAGLLLGSGFDDEVRAGIRPPLQLSFSAQSSAADRAALSVTVLDAVRSVQRQRPPVRVEWADAAAVDAGDLVGRAVPLLVLMALLIAGTFVTSFSLVEERERGTLKALLATPTRLAEVMSAKGALGAFLAAAMAVVTLALNGVLVGASPALLAGLAVGTAMSVQIGLIYGALAPDVKTLYALFKSLNLLLVGPVVFYLFPDWPQWIALAFPTYWFLDPIVQSALHGADLAQVGPTLLVGVAICLALVPVIYGLTRRAEVRIAVT